MKVNSLGGRIDNMAFWISTFAYPICWYVYPEWANRQGSLFSHLPPSLPFHVASDLQLRCLSFQYECLSVLPGVATLFSSFYLTPRNESASESVELHSRHHENEGRGVDMSLPSSLVL